MNHPKANVNEQTGRQGAPPLQGWGTERRRGFSLWEIALAAVVIAALIAIIAAVYNDALTRARVADTRSLLVQLRRALLALDDETREKALHAADSRHVLDALCGAPASAEIMRGAAPHLWECIIYPTGNDARTVRCVDAWGTPIRVITIGSANETQQRRLALAGKGAIFESAGPDRDFGDDAPVRQMDNISSDDPSVALAQKE